MCSHHIFHNRARIVFPQDRQKKKKSRRGLSHTELEAGRADTLFKKVNSKRKKMSVKPFLHFNAFLLSGLLHYSQGWKLNNNQVLISE